MSTYVKFVEERVLPSKLDKLGEYFSSLAYVSVIMDLELFGRLSEFDKRLVYTASKLVGRVLLASIIVLSVFLVGPFFVFDSADDSPHNRVNGWDIYNRKVVETSDGFYEPPNESYESVTYRRSQDLKVEVSYRAESSGLRRDGDQTPYTDGQKYLIKYDGDSKEYVESWGWDKTEYPEYAVADGWLQTYVKYGRLSRSYWQHPNESEWTTDGRFVGYSRKSLVKVEDDTERSVTEMKDNWFKPFEPGCYGDTTSSTTELFEKEGVSEETGDAEISQLLVRFSMFDFSQTDSDGEYQNNMYRVEEGFSKFNLVETYGMRGVTYVSDSEGMVVFNDENNIVFANLSVDAVIMRGYTDIPVLIPRSKEEVTMTFNVRVERTGVTVEKPEWVDEKRNSKCFAD